MKYLSILLLALLCATAQAQPAAYGGIAADAATTAHALAQGAAEANPLGWATVPLRLGVVAYASTLTPEQGVPVVRAVTQVSYGAAVANLVNLPVGMTVTLILWLKDKPERDFYAMCARIKAPEQRCVYKEPA